MTSHLERMEDHPLASVARGRCKRGRIDTEAGHGARSSGGNGADALPTSIHGGAATGDGLVAGAPDHRAGLAGSGVRTPDPPGAGGTADRPGRGRSFRVRGTVQAMDPTTDRLRSIPMFSHVDDEGLALIAEIATEFEIPANQILIERGQPGSGIFVLEEGEALIELPDGGHVTGGPGDFFGEIALLTDSVRTARVRARTPVTGVAISRRDFSRLLEREPRIAVAMLPVLARRLAELL